MLLMCSLQLVPHYPDKCGYKILVVMMLFLFFQIWLRKNCEHRGITHTLLFNGILSVIILYPYFALNTNKYYFLFALGAVLGLVSHIFYDSITIHGCPLFFPFSKKNVRLVKRLKLKSGKDDIYGIVFSLVILAIVVISKIRK